MIPIQSRLSILSPRYKLFIQPEISKPAKEAPINDIFKTCPAPGIKPTAIKTTSTPAPTIFSSSVSSFASAISQFPPAPIIPTAKFVYFSPFILNLPFLASSENLY